MRGRALPAQQPRYGALRPADIERHAPATVHANVLEEVEHQRVLVDVLDEPINPKRRSRAVALTEDGRCFHRQMSAPIARHGWNRFTERRRERASSHCAGRQCPTLPMK